MARETTEHSLPLDLPGNIQQKIDHFRDIWRNPSLASTPTREALELIGAPLVERLADGPIPIRIVTPFEISPAVESLMSLSLPEGSRFRPQVEKETEFRWYVYGDRTTGHEHIALIKALGNGEDLPIRVHSSCITAETFHASNCDCQEQLNKAITIAEEEGQGGVIWLNQEGRGNGTVAKAYQLKLMMEQGIDTVTAYEQLGYPSDQRNYKVAAEILQDLGVKSIRMITNSPDKLEQIQRYGIKVLGRIPCEIPPLNSTVRKDLIAKREHHGHFLELNEEQPVK